MGRGAMAEGMPFNGGKTPRHATWDSTRAERSSVEPATRIWPRKVSGKQDDGLMPRPGRVGTQRLPIDRGGR
jgi:hypothetical protein